MQDELTYRHPRGLREAFGDDEPKRAPMSRREAWTAVALCAASTCLSIAAIGLVVWGLA